MNCMMCRIQLVLIIECLLLVGCTTAELETGRSYMRSVEDRPKLESSLFKSDQAVIDEETIKRILSSKIELPKRAKIAVLKFSGQFGSYYDYDKTETYLKLQQSQLDTLSRKLYRSSRIADVAILPSLLTPKEKTIPMLREAAVRMQADLLLVFDVSSDIYSEYRLFQNDRIKAYSTCEVVLIDVRTGIIPFTAVSTRDFLTEKADKELSSSEARKRAEATATYYALSEITNRLLHFFNTLP